MRRPHWPLRSSGRTRAPAGLACVEDGDNPPSLASCIALGLGAFGLDRGRVALGGSDPSAQGYSEHGDTVSVGIIPLPNGGPSSPSRGAHEEVHDVRL
jgi:hypothetical protein